MCRWLLLEVTVAETRRGSPVDRIPNGYPMQLWFILEVSLLNIGSVSSQLLSGVCLILEVIVVNTVGVFG